jgi:DNA-binding NarL/FixJ family response regulator
MNKVLIIEDEEFYRNFLRKIVAQRYPCNAASNGSEARHLLRSKRYDVVLCDLRLPGDSGRELISFIRKEIDPDIQNIVITGFERDWSPVEATEENIFFYLKKGQFHPEELLKLIDSALQTRSAKLMEREYVSRLIASEKIAQAGKLATGIAHEINNPLQSLVVVLDHFREKVRSRRDADQLLTEIRLMERGVERISSVVRQLLELYRIDRDATHVDRLDNILEKVVSFLRPIGREQNARIVYRPFVSHPSVCVAENQFFYVLTNVCLALLDHRHGEIRISPHIHRGSAIVTIRAIRRDSGAGREKRLETGSGNRFIDTFGMDMTRGIQQWFKGSIRVASRESGEIVFVSLPLAQEPEQHRVESAR